MEGSQGAGLREEGTGRDQGCTPGVAAPLGQSVWQSGRVEQGHKGVGHL